MEKRKLVTPDNITAALKDIGVRKGQAIMVHTSLSSLGYVSAVHSQLSKR